MTLPLTDTQKASIADGYCPDLCTVGWYDNPSNTSWRAGPDCERARRLPVVQAMFERFGRWDGS